MSSFSDRIPKVISEDTEAKLNLRLLDLGLNLQQKLEIISIYPRGSKVYCWYFLDMKSAHKLPREEVVIKETKKKAAKKKVAKKNT